MAHRKAGGSAKSLRDSKPKFLGVKLADNQPVKKGQIIVRQRGTRLIPGNNVGLGKDHTIFSKADGTVNITKSRRTNHTGKTKTRSIVNVKTN